jgi:hypothetical protein
MQRDYPIFNILEHSAPPPIFSGANAQVSEYQTRGNHPIFNIQEPLSKSQK